MPIVFTIVADPVGSGFVDSLSRPGGNANGFNQLECSLSGKWVELLKEIAPRVTRRRRRIRESPRESASSPLSKRWPLRSGGGDPVNVRDASEIERGIAALACSGNGGMVVMASALSIFHRELIVALAARHKLPAVYAVRDFVASGGLISYGADFVDQYRRAAGYVDRILKGEKPAELPVQAPTRYELVLNLKPPRRSASTCGRPCSRAPTR